MSLKTPGAVSVGLVSLGCARTLVDSEVALGELLKNGYEYSERVEEADIAIVNTCAFTEEAKKESIDTILALVDLKKKNKIRALVVMGCLAQRYGKELAGELSEADGIIGTSSYGELARILEPLRRREKVFDVQPRPKFLLNADSPRKKLTAPHTTYVKISEGCINACSYCAIPSMKGRHRSRPIADISAEVAKLSAQYPLKELNLIGQDTAAYGFDLENRFMLAELVETLAKQSPEAWIRPLYAHPAHVTADFIALFEKYRNLCRYVDLPIEHSHPAMLERMNRGCTREKMDQVITDLRKVPGMVIRTAVIVGFPGETEEEFRDLLDYMKAVRFERLGAFTYSLEDGTRAAKMGDQIPEELKRERFDELMRVQREITADWNQTRVDSLIRVLVEEKTAEAGVWLGRSEADAPEVDGEVILRSSRDLAIGHFVNARIVEALDHDVIAEAIS